MDPGILISLKLHSQILRLHQVRFFKFNQLFTELEKLTDEENTRSWRKLIGHDLLIIDDFAFRRITQSQSEMLYQLVDTCYGNTSIILTSNRALPDWLDVFPDPVIGGAILDIFITSIVLFIERKVK